MVYNTRTYHLMFPCNFNGNRVGYHFGSETRMVLRPFIANYMFQIHRPHCYSSPPKFDHYDDVMPLLHHICNIFMRVIKSVLVDNSRRAMASNLIVNVVEGLVLLCYHGR